MSPRIRRYFRGRRLTPLIAVTVAALVFTVLLVLVRLRWRPLERADHGAASDINNLIAGQHTFVTIVRDVTLLGSTLVLSAVIAAGVILLLLRRQWRLAIYLAATGAGAFVLDPVLKSLVGRLRPVLAHPVAHAPGNSFPSGHALGSLVCYGAIYLAFLPAARGRWRTVFTVVIAVLVAIVGISRILLGVHYLSDVLGGWAIGVTWLGVTAAAFELSRRAGGRPVTRPVAEGLEPEAAAISSWLSRNVAGAGHRAGGPGSPPGSSSRGCCSSAWSSGSVSWSPRRATATSSATGRSRIGSRPTARRR